MWGLIKNEWLKFRHNKKFYGFLLVIFVVYMLPVLMTLVVKMNTYNGQVYPLSMFGVIVAFVIPIFLIILVAEIITDEYLSGNLALSLVHPVSRLQVLTAKAIFLLLVILGLLLYSLVISYGIGTIIFGWGKDFMMRGATFTMAEGVFITVSSYLSAALPLFAFSLFVTFIAFIFQGSAAVVGISAGVFMLLIILDLLFDQLRPVIITSYFNTVPIIFNYLANPLSIIFSLMFVSVFGFIFYTLALTYFLRKDMSS